MSYARRSLVAVTTVASASALLAVVQVAQQSDAAPLRPPAAAPAAPAPSPGPLAAVPGTAAPAGPGPARVGVARGPVTVRYTFDGGADRPITDAAGGHPLRALSRNGGTLSLVPQGTGLAVAYPRRCTLPQQRRCPRAILEGLRDDTLNPGTRPLTYGASVMMTHADLADGANVLQKGYSVGGVGQFKLQVDHLLGHPSCVVAGRSRIWRVEPALDVADGRWHTLACARAGDRLTMTVDGVERGSVRLPRTLSIANPEPLRIGGKGANTGNDQYAGRIDDVFLRID